MCTERQPHAVLGCGQHAFVMLFVMLTVGMADG
jgi:hypothetical protein